MESVIDRDWCSGAADTEKDCYRLAQLAGPPLQFPDEYPRNLPEALWKAASSGQGLTFIDDRGEEQAVSYQDLLNRALHALGALQNLGIAEQDQAVILQLDDLQEFLVAFWACLLGGLVPVPVLPFRNADPGDSSFRKLQRISAQLQQPLILMSDKNARSLLKLIKASNESQEELFPQCRVATFSDISDCREQGHIHTTHADDLAFLQFSSGSTSFPKGVRVTHANVLATVQAMISALDVRPESVLLNWMPFYHDMGIIAGHLMAVVATCKVVAMKPFSFVRRPLLWLTKIHEHRATITFSPNFGLKRIIEKATREQLAALDLSCLEVILNGAEPISVQTCERFLDLLGEACGLRRNCLVAGYGLAEASLAVSIAPRGEVLRKHILNRDALGCGSRVEHISAGDDKATWFADEGPVVAGMELRVVDDGDRILRAGTVGNIQIRGRSVTSGYYASPEANSSAFCGDWFRTGDLGFIHDDRFIITGRVKDVVYVNGQNYYSHDFEHACEDIRGLDRLVVIGYTNHEKNEEEILAFVACNKQYTGAREKTEILRKVQIRINRCFDVTPTQFILLKSAGEIPKTTSGKIIRHRLLENYIEGDFANQCIRLVELLEIAPDLSRELDSGKHVTIAELKLLIRCWWSDVLGISEKAIGDHDPFFSLGGTSIKAMEVLAMAEDTVDCSITHDMFKEYDTIHALAHYIARENISVKCRLGSLVRIAPGRSAEAIEDRHEDELPADAANEGEFRLLADIREDDIAIIGMGCVFPQADNVDQFWQLLLEGRDCITEFPNDRGNINDVFGETSAAANKTVSKWGSFVEHHHFDPAFFNMSEEEALTMDPHQRIFLNAAVQAIHDSGATGVEGSRMGVFVGASGTGFYQHREDAMLVPSLLTGSLANLAAARVSHAFNLKGPSLSVDTACSSSLASVDMACKSILRGESDTALAGGVQVMESLNFYPMFSRAGILSPQGRCFTFSDKANGFVPGEGAGAVVLKRYRQAIEDGDRVYAVIKASAMNNDGTSLGIMAPNPEGQENVILDALAQADIDPEEIGYVEAHGTGTDIGDLIEVRSLSLAFNKHKPVSKQQCAIGSVKTNLGHQLAAAGIAGLMKATLAVYHEFIPATLHCENERKALKLPETPFFVAHKAVPWPKQGVRRLAAVNSFGFGGTNVHVVLSSAYHGEVHQSLPARELEPQVFCLSARTGRSLDELRARFADFAASCPAEVNPADIAYSYAARRTHYRENRIAIIASTLAEAASLADGSRTDRTAVIECRALPKMRRRIAWLFSGQGSQHACMGKQLFSAEPAFRDAVNQCDEIIWPLLGKSMREMLVSPTESGLVNETEFAQPLIFTMDYAMARLWQSWGIKPDCMVGHSIGEYVAATLSGIFTLEDVLRIVVQRGALMGRLPAGGGMTATMLAPEQLSACISNLALPLDISACNGPSSTVVSGELSALRQLHQYLDGQDMVYTPLVVSHAFHSRHMDPVLEEFRQIISDVKMNAPNIPVVSNVTGKLYQGNEVNADYWVDHIRKPVQFCKGIQNLHATGVGVFLEIGAQAHLTGQVRRIIKDSNVVILSSMPKHTEDAQPARHIACSRGALYAHGINVDWRQYYAGHNESRWHRQPPPGGMERRESGKHALTGYRLYSLPCYPMERRSMYRMVGKQEYPFSHLFQRTGELSFRYVPDPETVLFRDHVVSRAPMLSAAGQCDLVSHLHHQCYSHAPKVLRNLSFHQPWLVNSQLTVSFEGDAEKSFQVIDAKGKPVLRGFSNTITCCEVPEPVDVSALGRDLPISFTEQSLYEIFRQCGIEYGCFHRNIVAMRASDREVVAHLKDARGNTNVKTHGYYLHPGMLDAAFQAAAGLLLSQIVDGQGNVTGDLPLMIPLGIEAIAVFKFIQDGEFYSRVTLARGAEIDPDSDILSCNVDICDSEGNACASITGLQMKRLGFAMNKKPIKARPVASESNAVAPEGHCSETAGFFRTAWQPAPLDPSSLDATASRWLVFGSPCTAEQDLAPVLVEAGVNAMLVPYANYATAEPSIFIDVFERAGPVNGILFMGDYAAGAAGTGAADTESLRILFTLLKTLARYARTNKQYQRIRLIRATRDACITSETDGSFDIRKSLSTGFLRSARIEFPQLDICQAEFRGMDVVRSGMCLAAELLTPSSAEQGGPETLYLDGVRHALLAEAVSVNQVIERPAIFSPEKVFWIIGGTSGIGQVLARHLAANYRCSLVLSGSRRLPEPAAYDEYLASHDDKIAQTIRTLRELEGLGAKVSYASTDVRSADSVRVSLEQIRQQYGRLNGVFFGALQLDDKMIVQKEWDEYRNMFDMRVDGLDELLRQLIPDQPEFVVLFSSMAGVTGNIGQTDYSASCAYMDALPYHTPDGLNSRIVSVQWGAWALGQQVSEVVLDHLRRNHLLHVTPQSGIEALEVLVLGDCRNVAFVPGSADTQQIANSINKLRQGLGSRTQRNRKPVIAEENTMSQPEMTTQLPADSGQLQLLMHEFARQRDMLLKLCESQNALLASAMGGLPVMPVTPTMQAAPPVRQDTPVVVPVAVEPVRTPVTTAAMQPVRQAATPQPETVRQAAPVAAAQPAAPATAPAGRPADLFTYVRSLMARAVEVPESDIDPDQNIMELGADSMTAMSMVKEMETTYEIELPATLLFEYSTLNELVDFLREEVGETAGNGTRQA